MIWPHPLNSPTVPPPPPPHDQPDCKKTVFYESPIEGCQKMVGLRRAQICSWSFFGTHAYTFICFLCLISAPSDNWYVLKSMQRLGFLYRNLWLMKYRRGVDWWATPFQLPRVIIYESVQLFPFVITDTQRRRSCWLHWQVPLPPCR